MMESNLLLRKALTSLADRYRTLLKMLRSGIARNAIAAIARSDRIPAD